MAQTININLECQEYLTKRVTQTLCGFIFNFRGKNYVISIHHFLPINKISETETCQKLPILINSSWSEILVLSPKHINVPNYYVYQKYHNKLPKPNDKLSIKLNDKIYYLKVSGYDFLPYDNLNIQITLPYIRASIKIDTSDITDLTGFSGVPVFDNNDKIVGIFSKSYSDDQSLLIIPIYVMIKNLKKKDNFHIYKFSDIPKKINTYRVKENKKIYHPTFKYDIPVSSYLLIEGDKGKTYVIQNSLDESSHEQMIIDIDYKYTLDCNLIKSDQNTYLITPRLLSLLKRIFSIKILQYIATLINNRIVKNETKELWLNYNQGKFIVM